MYAGAAALADAGAVSTLEPWLLLCCNPPATITAVQVSTAVVLATMAVKGEATVAAALLSGPGLATMVHIAVLQLLTAFTHCYFATLLRKHHTPSRAAQILNSNAKLFARADED